VRCYYTKFAHDIQFDEMLYQQFLKEQGLREHDIEHLTIHFITDFTSSHFKGNVHLEEGGAYFQRDEEYVEKMNETTLGLYQPYDPPTSDYAAIFLRPEKYKTPVHLLDPIFLNHPLLHETRHHIQHCLEFPCRKPVHAPVESELPNERNQPWERDAEQFASAYAGQVFFILPVSHPPKRSDLKTYDE
jgi:hypothetical protein